MDATERLKWSSVSSDSAPGLARTSAEPRTAEEVSGIHPLSGGATRSWYLPASPFAMWIFDRRSGALLAANDAALRAYGCTAAQLLACNVDDVCPGGELLTIPLAMPATWIGTVRQRRRDGSTFESDLALTDVADCEPGATMVLVHPGSGGPGSGGQPAADGAIVESRSRTLLGRP
jgi:PAS domain-containing protein